jgi:hypothetical protein
MARAPERNHRFEERLTLKRRASQHIFLNGINRGFQEKFVGI